MANKERKIDFMLYRIAQEDELLTLNKIIDGKNGDRYYIRSIEADMEVCFIYYSHLTKNGNPSRKRYCSPSSYFSADVLRKIFKAYIKEYPYMKYYFEDGLL